MESEYPHGEDQKKHAQKIEAMIRITLHGIWLLALLLLHVNNEKVHQTCTKLHYRIRERDNVKDNKSRTCSSSGSPGFLQSFLLDDEAGTDEYAGRQGQDKSIHIIS